MTPDTVLMLVGGAALVALIISLFRKEAVSTLPVFFSYIVFEFLLGLADCAVKHLCSANVYLLFWSVYAYLDLVFYCAVILEVGRNLRRQGKVPPMRPSLILAVFVLICFGLGQLIHWHLSPRPFLWRLSTYAVEITSLVQLAAFLTLVAWSSLSRFYWSRREFRIAFGLGSFALITFGVGIAYSNPSVHGANYVWLTYVAPICGSCVYLYWLHYFYADPASAGSLTRSAELVVAGHSDDESLPDRRDSAALFRLFIRSPK